MESHAEKLKVVILANISQADLKELHKCEILPRYLVWDHHRNCYFMEKVPLRSKESNIRFSLCYLFSELPSDLQEKYAGCSQLLYVSSQVSDHTNNEGKIRRRKR